MTIKFSGLTSPWIGNRTILTPKAYKHKLPITEWNGFLVVPKANWQNTCYELGFKVLSMKYGDEDRKFGVKGSALVVPAHWDKYRIKRAFRSLRDQNKLDSDCQIKF